VKSLWFQQRQKTCAFPVQCSRPLLAAIWLLGLVIWGGMLPSSVDAQDCRLVVDKSASPTTVDAGGVVEVTLTVRSDGLCTSNSSPIDVMLVLDRSGSMSGTRMQDAQNAAKNFVGQMNLGVDQVGIASFEGAASLDQPLTQNRAQVDSAIDRLYADGMTDIAAGLIVAESELQSSRHRTGSVPVIVVLSDGYHNGATDLFATAERIKQAGIRIISIGTLWADEYQLRTIASSDNDYYYAPTSSSLAAIYTSIAQTVRVAAHNIVLTDQLSDQVTLLADSFSGPVLPEEPIENNTLVWRIAAAPTTSMAVSYQVAMTDQPGTWPTNAFARADYVDVNGANASQNFPVPQVTVNATCGAPFVYWVEPAWACRANASVPLTLFGAGFYEPLAAVGSQQLSLQSVNESQIDGILDARGLAGGLYAATVTNQCPQPTSPDIWYDSFTVYEAPSALQIRPGEGRRDQPNPVVICSLTPLAPDTTAAIVAAGETTALEDQFIQSSTPECLQGTIPVGPESWGSQLEIVLSNSCAATGAGGRGQFRLLSSDLNNDLWGRSDGLWVSPSSFPSADAEIDVGLMVQRRGGKDAVPVTVNFYENEPGTAEARQIGSGYIPLLSPGVSDAVRITGTSTTAVDWTPSRGVGQYTLYAVIDPTDAVEEDIEANNILSRTVQVVDPLPPSADQIKPRVSLLTLAGGATVISTPVISLTVDAEDFAQPGVTSSGVNQMLFVEYLFSEPANLWVPVQFSPWMTYTRETTWRLVQQSGLRFVQAWVSDGAGNISAFPYQRRIHYTQPCEAVSRDGRSVYLVDASVGDVIEVAVRPCSGDPDLYLWPPDPNAPPYVSNLSGQEAEYVRVPPDRTAAITEAGVYQVEIYGYTRAEYTIQIEVYRPDPGARVAPAATRTAFENPDKETLQERLSGFNTQPPVREGNFPTSAAPMSTTNPPEPPATTVSIYLPTVTR
jgi:uncharacterized protein YegL